MKGCLRTSGVAVFWTAMVMIGISACGLLVPPNTIIPPEPSPSPLPQISPIAPPTPVLPPTPAPEPVPTPAKELPPPENNLPTVIGESTQSTDLISANYSWNYRGTWNWEMRIPLSLYQYYQKLPRPPTTNYSVYVTHPLDDPYIDLLVAKIKSIAQQEGYTEYQTVEFADAFVQSLPYTVDSVTTPFDEYPRYPLETLIDNGGDCEDTSILLASIIEKMGYGVVLVVLPSHVGVGVKGGETLYGTYWDYNGSKYYYVETTGENWGIGEIPDEYKDAAATLHPMIPVPILTHEGGIAGNGYSAEVVVKVSNLGTVAANNVTVFAGFDAGESMVWNSQQSAPFTLGIDQEATIKLNLRVPAGKHTRLMIQILVDSVLVDESHTDWFDT